jgi:hypothetical protein
VALDKLGEWQVRILDEMVYCAFVHAENAGRATVVRTKGRGGAVMFPEKCTK